MDIIDTIIKLGALCTAIVAIVLLIKKVVALVKKAYDFLHKLDANMNTLMKRDESQYKAILRLTITADHMPVSERLMAGKEYVEELHGNGDVKHIYEELKEKCSQVSD